MGTDGVVVIGAGGHGTVVTSTLLAAGIPVAGIVDDAPATHGTTILGVPVLGPVSLLRDRPGVRAIAAIGDNAVRKRLVDSLPQVEWVSAIHPAAVVAPEVTIGPGAMPAMTSSAVNAEKVHASRGRILIRGDMSRLPQNSEKYIRRTPRPVSAPARITP